MNVLKRMSWKKMKIEVYCREMLFLKDKDLQMKRVQKLVFAQHISTAVVNICQSSFLSPQNGIL